MKPLILLSPAERELADAAFFYEGRSPGLGGRFLDAFDRARADIAEHPARWPELRAGIRRRLLTGFPYGMLYREDEDRIIVVAIMHLHQRPEYWVDRL